MRSRPFPFWPHYDADEMEAVKGVLGSGRVNYWTGDQGRHFEQEYAAFVGTRYAVALMNGTVALEAAVRALGVLPGHEVITTSRTFIASASCVVLQGGVPVMADVDRVSQDMTADAIRAVLTERTRGIITVHLGGWPCDMDPILALARDKGLWVVEDCAQAHGATYKGMPVGSFGDAAAFSFCQDKIITTGGEGGMVTTNRHDLWDKIWSYKDHGKSFDAVYHREWGPGFRWLHESFGTNGRMTEMQAAIGRIQLRKLHEWVGLRKRNAAILTEGFSTIPGLRVTVPPEDAGHAYYKYYVFVEPEALRPEWSRDRIMEAVCAEGIPCGSGSCSEIYLEKAFLGRGRREGTEDGGQRSEVGGKGQRSEIRGRRSEVGGKDQRSEVRGRRSEVGGKGRLAVARELGETSLMFMVHPTLSVADMQDVVAAVRKVMGRAVRR